MSLRATYESKKAEDNTINMQTSSTQPHFTPTQQLHNLNEYSKVELENSLLKEALAKSSENCEELLKKLISLHQREERSREEQSRKLNQSVRELRESVESLKNANQILDNNINRTLSNLADKLEDTAKQSISDGINKHIEDVNKATKQIEKSTETTVNKLKNKCYEIENSADKLFKFGDWQRAIFWIGQITNIVTLIILFLILIGKI